MVEYTLTPATKRIAISSRFAQRVDFSKLEFVPEPSEIRIRLREVLFSKQETLHALGGFMPLLSGFNQVSFQLDQQIGTGEKFVSVLPHPVEFTFPERSRPGVVQDAVVLPASVEPPELEPSTVPSTITLPGTPS